MPTLDDIHATDDIFRSWVDADAPLEEILIWVDRSLSWFGDHEDLHSKGVQIPNVMGEEDLEFAFRRAVGREWEYDIVPIKQRTVDDYIDLGEVIDEG